MKKGIKYSLYGLLAFIVLLILAVPLIPAESYREEIETQISDALKIDVSLGDIALTSLPQPGLVVKDVELSDHGIVIVSAERISLFPVLVSLLSDKPVIRKINLSGVRLYTQEISRLTSKLDTDSSSESSPAISIKRITGDNNTIQIDDQTSFGPFKFTLDLNDSLKLKSFQLDLQDQIFQLNVLPRDDNYTINLQAKNWTIPYQPEINFTSLQIDGLLLKNRFHAKNIQAVLYEGNVNGNLIMDWNNGWALDSRLEVKGLNLAGLLELFNNHSLDGTASGKFTIKSNADEPDQLAENILINGDAQVVDGHLYNTDLEQAVRSLGREWKAGGQTPFDEFKTHVAMDATRIKLTQTSLTSSILGAKGHINILNMNDLKGELSVGLNDPTGIFTVPLMVAGTIDEPKVRPTNAALTGGGIGTVLLGPGVGTAVGTKVGEFVSKIGSFFSSGDDDKNKEIQQDKEDE